MRSLAFAFYEFIQIIYNMCKQLNKREQQNYNLPLYYTRFVTENSYFSHIKRREFNCFRAG